MNIQALRVFLSALTGICALSVIEKKACDGGFKVDGPFDKQTNLLVCSVSEFGAYRGIECHILGLKPGYVDIQGTHAQRPIILPFSFLTYSSPNIARVLLLLFHSVATGSFTTFTKPPAAVMKTVTLSSLFLTALSFITISMCTNTSNAATTLHSLLQIRPSNTSGVSISGESSNIAPPRFNCKGSSKCNHEPRLARLSADIAPLLDFGVVYDNDHIACDPKGKKDGVCCFLDAEARPVPMSWVKEALQVMLDGGCVQCGSVELSEVQRVRRARGEADAERPKEVSHLPTASS